MATYSRIALRPMASGSTGTLSPGDARAWRLAAMRRANPTTPACEPRSDIARANPIDYGNQSAVLAPRVPVWSPAVRDPRRGYASWQVTLCNRNDIKFERNTRNVAR